MTKTSKSTKKTAKKHRTIQVSRPGKTTVTIRTNPLDIMAAEYIALFGDALKKAKKKEAK